MGGGWCYRCVIVNEINIIDFGVDKGLGLGLKSHSRGASLAACAGWVAAGVGTKFPVRGLLIPAVRRYTPRIDTLSHSGAVVDTVSHRRPRPGGRNL